MIKELKHYSATIATKIVSLQMVSYQIEAELIGFYEIPQLQETIEDIINSSETFFGYYCLEQLVGVISFKYDKQELDIYRLVIHPNFFRRSYGMKLIQYVLNLYPDKLKCFVATASKNIPAKILYKKVGFVEIEEIKIDEIYITKLEKRFESEQTQ